MEKFDEFVVKNKRDLERVSDKTRVLRVKCQLDKEDAIQIAKKCRLLEEVVFDKKIFFRADPEAKDYLDKYVFVDFD